MVRGKPGFERVMWAFRNVLIQSVAWLFCNLKSPTDGSGPIAAYQPLVRSVEPLKTSLQDVLLPNFPRTLTREDHEQFASLLEWITLVTNLAPKVLHDDAIDSYLSRHQVPYSSGQDHGTALDIVRLRWAGFASPKFVSQILLAALKACDEEWFALCTTAFSGEAYTLLKTSDQTFIWEYMD
jgi:ribonucleases P/MRP protein subunit RPP40